MCFTDEVNASPNAGKSQPIEATMRWTLTQVADAVAESRGMGWTPWPGWPVSRLILALYVPENSSLPYTVRLTMDTTMWPPPWRAGQWRQWWRSRSSRSIGWLQDRCITVPIPSRRCTSWHAQCARIGAGKFAESRVPSEKLPQGDPGGTAGCEATRPEVRGQFQ